MKDINIMYEFQKYSSVFFWDFKRRDNVEYNFELVNNLIVSSVNSYPYEYGYAVYKPVFIILMSIIECILYDFLMKIQQHTYEKVPNLSKQEINSIKAKDVPNVLANYIEICKKHNLLGEKNNPIYEMLSSFAITRNRIHVQNVKCCNPLNESELWTSLLVKSCGGLLKDICQIMCNKYPRPDHFRKKYSEQIHFPEPWNNLKP